jgi:predicted Fe-S protein YdhL (DUF1289 family)
MANPPDSPILTPCIKVCVIDTASGLCTGCLRSLEEVARWGNLTQAARAELMARLPARRALIATETLPI